MRKERNTIKIKNLRKRKKNEKRDCSGIKKFSKAYIACKSGNFKTSMKKNNIAQTGTNVSKGIVGKVKNFGKKINNPFKKKK